MKMTVVSARPGIPDEEYEVSAVPRIGDLISTGHMAAARVQDVVWYYPSGDVTVHAR